MQNGNSLRLGALPASLSAWRVCPPRAGRGGGLHGAVIPVGSYEITVTAGGTTVQASTPVTLKCEVESKGQLLETL
jgi:hypothetical protein